MAKSKSSSTITNTFFQRNKAWIIVLVIIALIIFIILVWSASAYNGLVAARENVNSKWGTVQADYQRRADLIPNLVSTVGAYAKQEKTVLEDVTNARAKVGTVQLSASDLSDPAKLAAFQSAQSELSGSLSRLLVVAENYPQLKSGDNFLALQNQLEGTENRIKVSRMDFNNAVQDYDTRLQRFPTVIVARMFGFEKSAYFTADEGASAVPVVNKDALVA